MKPSKKHRGINVFYSYASADKDLRDQLANHLIQLKREELISEWHDQQILAGSDRVLVIDQALHSADLILLLISADFLASDVQYYDEMYQALERHKRGEVCVIPVIVRPCDWQHSPFAHLQCLPPNTKPVTTWDNQDEAFASIATSIRHTIEEQLLQQEGRSTEETQYVSTPEQEFSSGEERESRHFPSLPREIHSSQKIVRCDWGDAPDVPVFFGRTKELTLLEQWITQDHCRLVALVGMAGVGKTRLSVKLGRGGIGKTDLSLKLARGIEQQFDSVIWRRLLNAPKLSELLLDLVKFLSNQQEVTLPNTVSEQIARLLHYLRKSRCLVILDNAEMLLQGDKQVGQYVPGYEEYGQLFEQIADVAHQSCLLLTSREKLPEVARRESKTRPVRSLELRGLSVADGKKIFAEIGTFSGSKEDWKQLNVLYNGNPLALELAARHIKAVFIGGRISEFLNEGKPIVTDLRDLLDWHFNRLSDAHKEVMYWFAINREPTTLSELREDILSQSGKEQISSTLDTLQRLVPLEKSARGFTLQPVLIEYMTELLVEQVVVEVRSGEMHLFNIHALLKTSVSDYVRDIQSRLILKPISKKLCDVYGNQARLEGRLKEILSLLRERFPFTSGYAGGNVLNLLCSLEVDLRGYNFSDLPVWQAYLQGVNVREVNFAHANFAKSVFTDSFASILCVVLSPQGDLLAAGTAADEIRLWHVKSGLPLCTLRGHGDWIYSVTFSPDGRTLASASGDRTVRLWEVSSGRCLNTLQGHTRAISSVAFSPDGKALASGSDDGMVRLWEVSSGMCLNILQGHTKLVRSVAFSPGGRTLVSGSDDQTVRLWEVSSGQCLNTLQGHTNNVYSVAFSPDGKTLASGSYDQTVRLWSVSKGQCLNILPGHAKGVGSVAFSPDGKTLASGSTDQTVHLWEVSSGACFNILQGYGHPIWSVAFNPDGKILASGSTDQTVRLWEIGTGQCLNTLQGHTSAISSVAFSPDGKTLVSGSYDQTARLWDVNNGQCLNTLQGHSHSVKSVAFSSDGKTLASGSFDGLIKLWDSHTGTCLHTLRSDRPYERMNITQVKGLTEGQKAALRLLGAVEEDGQS